MSKSVEASKVFKAKATSEGWAPYSEPHSSVGHNTDF